MSHTNKRYRSEEISPSVSTTITITVSQLEIVRIIMVAFGKCLHHSNHYLTITAHFCCCCPFLQKSDAESEPKFDAESRPKYDEESRLKYDAESRLKCYKESRRNMVQNPQIPTEIFCKIPIKILCKIQIKIYVTRSLGALRAPTSSLRPFGPALGHSGLLDFVLRALRALRPCDPRNGAMIVNTLSTDY